MLIQLAQGWLWRSPGLVLAVWLGLAMPVRVNAQNPPAADEVPAADPVAVPDDAATASTGARQQTELEERFNDPRAVAAIQNSFPQLFANALPLRSNDLRAIEAMVAGSAAPNRELLDAYAKYQLSQLSRPQNIAALADPTSSARSIMAYEELASNLRSPLERTQSAGLRTTYSQVLAGLADEVLQNQLYPRTMYMVALSRARDASAIPVFARVLRDRDQPLTLKILAATGLTELTGGGAQDLRPEQSREAALALTDFLTSEPDTFWPAQYRALQALGALRQSASDPLKPEADISGIVLGYLADPDAEPAVKAWAAWAMGMLRPTTRTNQYNFQLIALHIGNAAIDLATQIVETQAENPERAVRLTDLLFQLYLGLVGTSQVRDAGLLKMEHPSLAEQRASIQQIADRVRDVLASAVELTRDAAPQQRPQYRQALQGRIDTLKSTLAAVKPASLALYPGGDQFPVGVADAAPGPQARLDSGQTTGR